MTTYGDVESTVQQRRLLSNGLAAAAACSACNFGNSHATHHFFVAAFYLRELVRRDAHAAMRSHGVRFDDVGTFSRANRWGSVDSMRRPVKDRFQSRPLLTVRLWCRALERATYRFSRSRHGTTDLPRHVQE